MTTHLPVQEYVDRYGEQEAIRLTFERPAPDTDPPTVPVRDDTKIETAIVDAEEEAEGYISRRYTLPLADTPRVLKSWVAALAREKLHKTRPTPEVKEAADRARAQLKEVSMGLFKLLLGDDTPPATTVNGESVTSGDRVDPLFSRESLDSYVGLGRGGYHPCWRR